MNRFKRYCVVSKSIITRLQCRLSFLEQDNVAWRRNVEAIRKTLDGEKKYTLAIERKYKSLVRSNAIRPYVHKS